MDSDVINLLYIVAFSLFISRPRPARASCP